MKTNTCTCKHCGNTAILVPTKEIVPSFDDEGRWDGEDILEFEEIICHNPDCESGLIRASEYHSRRPLPQQECDDDLPF